MRRDERNQRWKVKACMYIPNESRRNNAHLTSGMCHVKQGSTRQHMTLRYVTRLAQNEGTILFMAGVWVKVCQIQPHALSDAGLSGEPLPLQHSPQTLLLLSRKINTLSHIFITFLIRQIVIVGRTASQAPYACLLIETSGLCWSGPVA